MKSFLRLVAIAFVIALATPVGAVEDFTGKWSGSFQAARPDGSAEDDGIFMNLTHKGAELSGTAGPNADQQWKIAKGVVKGDDVTFDVQARDGDGPLISFALKFADGHLKGVATAQQGDQKMSAKIDVTRVK